MLPEVEAFSGSAVQRFSMLDWNSGLEAVQIVIYYIFKFLGPVYNVTVNMPVNKLASYDFLKLIENSIIPYAIY